MVAIEISTFTDNAALQCRLGYGGDNVQGIQSAGPCSPSCSAAPHRHVQSQLCSKLPGKAPATAMAHSAGYCLPWHKLEVKHCNGAVPLQYVAACTASG